MVVFFCGLRRDIIIRFIDIVGIALTFLIFFLSDYYNYMYILYQHKSSVKHMDFENVLPNTGGDL